MMEMSKHLILVRMIKHKNCRTLMGHATKHSMTDFSKSTITTENFMEFHHSNLTKKLANMLRNGLTYKQKFPKCSTHRAEKIITAAVRIWQYNGVIDLLMLWK